MDFPYLSKKYKQELLQNVLPFWQKHSLDLEQGGYFTCLLRNGERFDTDKFTWLQARQVWMFASLYEKVKPRKDWLEVAIHGADFLENHGRNKAGDWYFSLNRSGQPLIEPYNIFSDCFAAMAFGQLYKVTRHDPYATIATATFDKILQRQSKPKGIYTKEVAGSRPLKNFALPMILCNLCLELEELIHPIQVNKTIDTCIETVMVDFYDPSTGLILENIQADGTLSDSFEGRLINPGHAIEAMWFIMELANRNQDQTLMTTATERALQMLEYGWDKVHGGIFYFMDRKGHPTQQLEWDQKLWWVHLETLIALLKGYRYTKNPACLHWFEKVHEYTWSHFKDTKHGEWFGYLNRQGAKLLTLKGGKWKGCFHVPRGLWKCWKELELIAKASPIG